MSRDARGGGEAAKFRERQIGSARELYWAAELERRWENVARWRGAVAPRPGDDGQPGCQDGHHSCGMRRRLER